MTLGQQQRIFAILFAELICYIYECGYEVSIGDVFRDPRVHGEFGCKESYSTADSNHKLKLAGDLNLFKDGSYLSSTESHRKFGEYWEGMHPHCRWGGRFRDGNHYEFTPSPWR